MGAYLAVRASVAGLLATAAVVAIGVQASEVSSTGDYLFIGFLFGAPWVAGRIARRQHAATEAAERRAADAVADERARIARELHDVVAHSVSVIVVQAGAAEQVIDRDPAAAREALRRDPDDRDGRRSSSCGACSALLRSRRRRAGELDAAAGPRRSSTRSSSASAAPGSPVELDGRGRAPRRSPPGVDLAAYRIVQEALTNALKHAAPAARHACAVRYEPRRARDRRDRRRRGPTAPHGGGHGLVGMRERVALYGGALDAGPRPGGGFPCPRPARRREPVIRVLIADDQALVRGGFRVILDAQPTTSRSSARRPTARGRRQRARRCTPDVVLMDIRMPELDGLEATRRARRAPGRPPRVLILTTFDLDEYVYEALRAGASGFLLKDVDPPEQLVDAVRVVAARRGAARARRSPGG